MTIKIKESFITEANSNRIKGYLLSKAMRKEEVTDAEIKKVYGMGETEFKAAVDKLVKDGVADKE
jgi:hypothetical protein